MRIWDIEIYEGREKRETILGLTASQKITLMELFDRTGISAQAIEYDSSRAPTGETETVNI